MTSPSKPSIKLIFQPEGHREGKSHSGGLAASLSRLPLGHATCYADGLGIKLWVDRLEHLFPSKSAILLYDKLYDDASLFTPLLGLLGITDIRFHIVHQCLHPTRELGL